MEELKIVFFIPLRVPTLRFGGSFFLYLTFYSNPFWRGVERLRFQNMYSLRVLSKPITYANYFVYLMGFGKHFCIFNRFETFVEVKGFCFFVYLVGFGNL